MRKAAASLRGRPSPSPRPSGVQGGSTHCVRQSTGHARGEQVAMAASPRMRELPRSVQSSGSAVQRRHMLGLVGFLWCSCLLAHRACCRAPDRRQREHSCSLSTAVPCAQLFPEHCRELAPPWWQRRRHRLPQVGLTTAGTRWRLQKRPRPCSSQDRTRGSDLLAQASLRPRDITSFWHAGHRPRPTPRALPSRCAPPPLPRRSAHALSALARSRATLANSTRAVPRLQAQHGACRCDEAHSVIMSFHCK